jgi:hypothetical protein
MHKHIAKKSDTPSFSVEKTESYSYFSHKGRGALDASRRYSISRGKSGVLQILFPHKGRGTSTSPQSPTPSSFFVEKTESYSYLSHKGRGALDVSRCRSLSRGQSRVLQPFYSQGKRHKHVATRTKSAIFFRGENGALLLSLTQGTRGARCRPTLLSIPR